MPLSREGLVVKRWGSFLLRRKLTIFKTLLAAGIVLTVVRVLVPPTFAARATLLIKYGREFMYRSEAGGLEHIPAFSLAEVVNAELEVLRSRELARRVVQDLGIAALYPEVLEEEQDAERALVRAVSVFLSGLSATAVLESSIIKLTFEHGDPGMAAVALNLLVEKFKERHLQIFGGQRTSFLFAKLEEHEEKLARAEQALAEFRRKERIYLSPEERQLLLSRRFNLRAELDSLNLKLVETRHRLTLLPPYPQATEGVAASSAASPGASSAAGPALAATLPEQGRGGLQAHRRELSTQLGDAELKIAEVERKVGVLKALAKDPEGFLRHLGAGRLTDAALVRLLDLELKEDELSRDFRDRSRELSGVRSEIRHLESLVKENEGGMQGQEVATLEDEIAGLRARRSALLDRLEALDLGYVAVTSAELKHRLDLLEARRSQAAQEIETLEKEIQTLEANEERLRVLGREITFHEINVQRFREKCREASTADELERLNVINIEVIEAATPPIGPRGLLEIRSGASRRG